LEEIRLAYLRGQAFACADGQAGIDLLIPVLLPRKPPVSLITQGETRAKSGVFSSNDSIISAGYPENTFSIEGRLCRKRPSNLDTSSLLTILKNAEDKQHPRETQGTELTLDRFSIIEIQSRNKDYDPADGDFKNNPGFSGIFPPNGINRPFLAIRHVLRGKKPVERIELLDDQPFRFGLVFGKLAARSSPFFDYRKKKTKSSESSESSETSDRDLGDKISRIIDTRMEPFVDLPDYLSRFALAFGGQINKLKFTSEAIEKLSKKIQEVEGETKKTRVSSDQ
jgi:hypothetical protein